MKKLIYIIGFLFFTLSVKAHQPTSSTTMLVENENKVWVLQISASLTAFQQEVKFHFADTPYKTTEEFQKMVIAHIKSNFEMTFNDGQTVTLSEGVVRLGHETKVVFEVFGIPEDISSITVKNETFKDIHHNQSSLVILKEGFNREKFVLDETNNHKLKLEVDGNKFQIEKKTISESSLSAVVLILMMFLGVGFLVFKISQGKKLKLLND